MRTDELTIILADDDSVMRSSMAQLLRSHPAIGEVLETGDGLEILRIVTSEKVDAVLMNVDMPVLDGVSVTALLSRELPSLPVLMLTMFVRVESLRRALDVGARGFLTKDTHFEEIVEAILTACGGEMGMSPRPTKTLVGTRCDYPDEARHDPEFVDRAMVLPSRLWSVFNLLIEASSNRTISRELGLSESSVQTQVAQILELADCETRSEVALRALKAGISSLPLKTMPIQL